MTTRSNQFRCLREQALQQADNYHDQGLFSPAMRTVVLETADGVYEDLPEEEIDLYCPRNRQLAHSFRPSLSA